MKTTNGIARRLLAATGGFLMLGMCATTVSAQTANPDRDRAVPVTKILAVGSLTPKATPALIAPVMKEEVPATVRLYLAGKLDQWYVKTDHTGVVFIVNATDVAQAHALLDALPLGKAGLMTFVMTPLGPLQPLSRLLP